MTNVPACTAWLVKVGQVEGAVPLCDVHLARFSVPRGWTLLDERPTGREKFSAPVAESSPEPAAEANPKATSPAVKAAGEPTAEDAAEPSAEDAGTDAESDPEASSHLWSGKQGDATTAARAPASPLLSRAFKGPDDETGDQRRLAIFQRSTRSSPAVAPDADGELPFPPADESPLVNGQ